MSHILQISRWLGAAGVSNTENPRARKVGIIFELPMLVAALGILLRWWGETSNVEFIYDTLYFDIFIWALFAIETLTLCLLTSRPSRYLRENWLNLVIILMGFTLLMGWELQLAALRILRLLIVFALLAHVGNRVKKMLSRNQLGPH